MGSEEIFQLLNYKGISELFFFDAIPSLKLSFNPQQAAASESFNRQGGGREGQNRKSPVSAIFLHYEQQETYQGPIVLIIFFCSASGKQTAKTDLWLI